MIMHVVIATDGSPAAQQAVELAAAINWPAGSMARLVTVVEPWQVMLAEIAPPSRAADAEYAAENEAAAQKTLDAASKALLHARLNVSHTVLHGRPASKILESAADFGADLIVVGSRGHGTIASMMLGSVSAEVADGAHCPVLVARRPGLTRVVLGADGSSFSRVAEDLVANWPIFDNVPIEATHVEPTDPWLSALALSTYVPPADGLQRSHEAFEAEQHEIASSAERRLNAAGRAVTGRVVQGNPAAELIRRAVQSHADLIVVGTHGRTGLNRVMSGSVARNIMLHAPCSVLLVRGVHTQVASAAA